MTNALQVIPQMEIVELVTNIAACYRDIKVNAEMQKTEREKLRQQARVLIAQHEADTNKAIEEIRKDSALNVELIRAVSNIMTQNNVDKDIIDFCKCLIEKLR